ncbi:hypothetical protein O3M35_004122 [Rhynocoris fuscipes]|uniref:Ropporin-1-like protein n=1 Tax=Rhynocoris fuscipes TaxID=488301 RepID=A0AAW1CJ10_9HEMI
MPDLVEHMYSSHQITIPPTLPTVLKKYAKAAIRTQPRDLLVWSASYFKALTYGIPLPTKERLEYPPVQTISGLSPGYLRVLINQIGNNAIAVLRTDIEAFWKGICLSDEALEEIFSVGGFGIKFNWFKFIAICAGYLESNLTRTMILLCELITDEPSGGSASIPVHKFLYLYKYLARLECGPNELEKEDHHSHQRKITDADIHGISEPFSGDDISYKDEGKIEKSESSISWQSVLKRMGKQETNISESTVNIGADESMTRGIAWQRIAEIEESEPDSSDTIMQSEYYDSSMGVQVFDYTEDKQMKKTSN